jgi:hypothetical protein
MVLEVISGKKSWRSVLTRGWESRQLLYFGEIRNRDSNERDRVGMPVATKNAGDGLQNNLGYM